MHTIKTKSSFTAEEYNKENSKLGQSSVANKWQRQKSVLNTHLQTQHPYSAYGSLRSMTSPYRMLQCLFLWR